MTATRDLYVNAGNQLVKESGVNVRKWRNNTTGVAYTKADDWGIESPRPVGPVSFGVFAHEVGHQMLHRHNSKPRWLEEIEAWEYALEQFDRFELPGKDKCKEDARKSLLYAAKKAERRASPETAQRILDRYGWVWDNAPSIRQAALGLGAAVFLGAFLAETVS
jgi:hypothetical protein